MMAAIPTTLDTEPDDMLEAAKGELDYVLIIGRDEDGEIWVSSSSSDIGIAFVDMHMAKELLINCIIPRQKG